MLTLAYHSPYFLDLYRDHPEEIVIAHRIGQDVRFESLSERPDIEEILGEAPLGEVWYSGILGGVPSERGGLHTNPGAYGYVGRRRAIRS